MSFARDLSGKVFGRWQVRGERPICHGAAGVLYWQCECRCGAVAEVRTSSLLSGNSKSCGCLHRERSAERARRHGGTYSHEWHSWVGMRRRCLSPRNQDFPKYGGRGISICAEWGDFTVFLKDMGPRPLGRSLDRINNDGNYEPGNCRWATPREQARNTRRTRNVTIGPLTLCLAAWAEESGKDERAIRADLLRGMNPAHAVYALG